jgi:hypothetical protein
MPGTCYADPDTKDDADAEDAAGKRGHRRSQYDRYTGRETCSAKTLTNADETCGRKA